MVSTEPSVSAAAFAFFFGGGCCSFFGCFFFPSFPFAPAGVLSPAANSPPDASPGFVFTLGALFFLPPPRPPVPPRPPKPAPASPSGVHSFFAAAVALSRRSRRCSGRLALENSFGDAGVALGRCKTRTATGERTAVSVGGGPGGGAAGGGGGGSVAAGASAPPCDSPFPETPTAFCFAHAGGGPGGSGGGPGGRGGTA